MSRSGYTDDDDGEDVLALGRWRGRVASAIRGKRGQALLRELAAALDAMPHKGLAAGSLATEEGDFCALGTIAAKHGIDERETPSEYWDDDDWEIIAKAFNVSPVMIREIVYENDEFINDEEWIDFEICGPVRRGYPDYGRHTTSIRVPISPEIVAAKRWSHMRAWIASQIRPETPTAKGN